jgi:hypothetical protein
MASGGGADRRERGLSELGHAGGGLAGAAGRDGTDVSLLPKLRVDVRSPTALRRQADRFGTDTPKRVSRKRSIDVWSNVSELT